LKLGTSIHILDLAEEVLLGFSSLNLESGSQEVILNREHR
jgi:hypothetical protein